METLQIYIQYLFFPLALALYALHIKIIKIQTRLEDYLSLKSDIYTSLKTLEKDVHHLIKIREEEH